MTSSQTQEMTGAEATRLSWEELGKDATQAEIWDHLKEHYPEYADVPSSTISLAKKQVWGKGGRGHKRKTSPPEENFDGLEVTDQTADVLEREVLFAARDLLRAAGGKDSAIIALTSVEELQV